MNNLVSIIKPITNNVIMPMWSMLLFISVVISMPSLAQSGVVQEYAKVLKATGRSPIQFVNEALHQADLLIFDDAIHSAQEPFDFYQELVSDPEFHSKVRFVFIEVFSIAAQSHIDQYLASVKPDKNLLKPVFQNDFSGFGWRYETYLSLLEAIWNVNQKLPVSAKIKVIGVDQPVFWKGINSRKDYDDFSHSLEARDYFMFLEISRHMEKFSSGKKGIFLTNTRHAYTNLHSSEGHLFWNCGTFFRQRFPGKTLSVRMHNVSLSISNNAETKSRTIEGTDGLTFKWVRLDNGKWDSAFALNGNKPVGFSIINNSFGKTKYIGNQMRQARPDQTMDNAYDAVIFLELLEDLEMSATLDFFYDDEFKLELKRRIEIIYGSEIKTFFSQNGCSSLDECIRIIATKENRKKTNLAGN